MSVLWLDRKNMRFRINKILLLFIRMSKRATACRESTRNVDVLNLLDTTFFSDQWQNTRSLGLIIWRAFNFRQAVHNAVNKQAVKHISYLLGDSPYNSSLSRIIELSSKGNGVLEERTLTELPKISDCRMIRLAGKSSFIRLPLNAFPLTLAMLRLR